MLYEYLTENFSPGDIIKTDDIQLSVPSSTIRWQLKQLVDSGKVIRLDKGIYCIPQKSFLGVEIYPSAEEVVKSKYINIKNNISGYFSGAYFANQIGISTQMPNDFEVVTNEAGNPVRKVQVCGRNCILRKSSVLINDGNFAILRLLDLLKNFDSYNELPLQEAALKIAQYIRNFKILKSDFDNLLKGYPDKTYRTVYELRLYDVFA